MLVRFLTVAASVPVLAGWAQPAEIAKVPGGFIDALIGMDLTPTPAADIPRVYPTVAAYQLDIEHRENPARFQRDRVGSRFEVWGDVLLIDADYVEIGHDFGLRGRTAARMKGLTLDEAAMLDRGDRIRATCTVVKVEEQIEGIFLLDRAVILEDCLLERPSILVWGEVVRIDTGHVVLRDHGAWASLGEFTIKGLSDDEVAMLKARRVYREKGDQIIVRCIDTDFFNPKNLRDQRDEVIFEDCSLDEGVRASLRARAGLDEGDDGKSGNNP